MEQHQMVAKQGAELRKGPWLEEEDEALIAAVSVLGERRWDALAKASGLRRSGKSCRLRWMNYLRPNLKHGHITPQEEELIIKLHKKWGNRWARIARSVPGRTDNEIKNYWRCYLRKEALLLQQEQALSTNTTKQQPWEQNSMVGMVDEDASTASSSSSETGDRIFDNLRMCAEYKSGTIDDGLWSAGLAYSPYETRLLDWISSTCSKMETVGDECSSNYPGSGGVSGGGYCSEISLWDNSAVSIWDMA